MEDTVLALARFIETPFTVWDIATQKGLYSAGCYDYSVPLPDDIASLEVIRIYSVNDMIYLDVNTAQ